MINFFKRGKTCILILGMHRSGTSCLAGTLQQSGLFLGTVYEQNPFNKKGNRENARIMNLNNSLLSYNNGSWNNPPENILWNDKLIEERNLIYNDFVNQEKKVWGFKDPRTIITLPFWIDIIKNPKFVASFRNPESVAKSLLRRDNMPKEQALSLWKLYNKKLLDLYERNQFPVISFDISKQEYIQRVNKIADRFKLPLKINDQSNVFFEESLRNSNTEFLEQSEDEEAILIYNKLLKIYKSQA
jgi:hypothetical protein